MNKVLISAAAAAALLLASCGGGNNEALELKAAAPTLATLKRTVELSGVLAPVNSAQVYAKLQGQASRIAADVGSHVSAGDVLLEIDAHELRAQLSLADASIATVKQQAAQALVGISTAQTNYDQAKRALDRINSLEDQSALSKAQIDDANSKVELTQRALDAAKLQYKTLNESGLGQALAQEDVVKSQISNSILRAPITGVVTNRNINPGELTSTSNSLFSIAAIDSLKLQGTVSQDVVSLLSEGRQVSVVVDGLPGAPLDGRVTQIGPVAAATGQYFPVVVTINKPGKALAGMTARVSLDVIAPEAPVLPLGAVKTDQGRAWVYLIQDGKAHQTEVGLGLSDGRSVQVVRGLKNDQVVALTNVSLLTDGAAVKVLADRP
jgi:RND family efflux transporter MFP subunit